MAMNLSIKGVPEHVAERLRARAERNHRSLQGELMAIVSEAAREVAPAAPSPARDRPEGTRVGWRSSEDIVAELRRRFPSPPQEGIPLAVDIIRARSRLALAMKSATAYVAEPPLAYRVKSPVVVDCSILGALLFDESQRETAARVIEGRVLHAPWLLDHEIANVADKKRRAGLSPELLQAGLTLYEEQQVQLHRTPPADALALAVAYSLSTYDAAYLALASQLRAPLVTFDHKLGKAALRHLSSLE